MRLDNIVQIMDWNGVRRNPKSVLERFPNNGSLVVMVENISTIRMSGLIMDDFQTNSFLG
jgi:hypothetical protein